jgi:hypothetical protein
MTAGLRPLPAVLALLLALAIGPSAPLAQSGAVAPLRVTVNAKPIVAFSRSEPERRRFGQLEFRGGLALTANSDRFGGISGIRLEADGRNFLALTDRAYWLRGRILAEGDRPTGIADTEIAPMLGANGRPLIETKGYDTESLARADGMLFVSIERVQRLVRFDYAKDGFAARAQPVTSPPGLRDLPSNQGIEALVFVPKSLPLGGTLIAISERGLDGGGNIRGFLVGGPSPGAFSVRRSNDFDVTDAALTPSGDLFILERHFSFTRGGGMRIRRVPLTDIKPGALIGGTVLIEADNANQIDNMEALDVHRNAAGETILTVMSDDNFSPLQRTLLLRFALIED